MLIHAIIHHHNNRSGNGIHKVKNIKLDGSIFEPIWSHRFFTLFRSSYVKIVMFELAFQDPIFRGLKINK